MTTTPNRRLTVLAPTAPPGVCGVSDYAYQTALQLADCYEDTEIGVAKMPSASPAVSRLLPIAHWPSALARACSSSAANDVLLNYTPASYARSGWPIELIATLRRFKEVHRYNRLFVFIHETWSDSPGLKIHHQIRNAFTKRSIGQIGELADGVAVVTHEQQRRVASLLPTHAIRINPIGANILPTNRSMGLRSPRQAGVWVVFGLAHSRLWAIQAHLSLLRSLCAQGRLRQLRAVGPTGNSYARREANLIARSLGPKVLFQLGPLPPAEVSQQLLLAEAGLTGQSPDSLRKSGTFAALAAHGVPVICEAPASLAEPPGSALFRPAELLHNPELIASSVGDERRRRLHEWFWSTRSWEAIGQGVREWIGETVDSHCAQPERSA